MNIYIDNDFKCRLTGDGTMRKIETDAFEGKCAAYIESCRFVPYGAIWVRADGMAFEGEMIVPCVDSAIRDAYQAQYESMLPEIQVREGALAVLGVTADD